MSKLRQFLEQNNSLTPAIFYILLSLVTQNRHGYDILKQIEADSYGKVKLGFGSLYGAIKRMLEDKMIRETDIHLSKRKYY